MKRAAVTDRVAADALATSLARFTDFAALAADAPELAAHVAIDGATGRGRIDFSDAAAARALTLALLRRDLGLDVRIPPDALCPAVAVRLLYVEWVEQLVRRAATAPVRGVDVGTGASAIYALIACARNPTWRVRGTDVSDEALRWAADNVARNAMGGRVELRRVSGRTVLAEALADVDVDVDVAPDREAQPAVAFVMCNPPFYADEAEQTTRAAKKARAAPTAPLGRPHELHTAGGEIAFVRRMIAESAEPRHRTRVRWFTSKLGIRTSLDTLLPELRALPGVLDVRSTVLAAGRTRRWAVAWSFVEHGGCTAAPVRGQIDGAAVRDVAGRLQREIAEALRLDVRVLHDADDEWTVEVHARENTWNRRARRLRDRGGADGALEQLQLALRVRVTAAEGGTAVECSLDHAPDQRTVQAFEHLARLLLARAGGVEG